MSSSPGARRERRAAVVASFLALVVLVTPAARAAPPTAALTGRVVDPHGDPVPGAVVTLVHARHDPWTLVTDENGMFRSPALEPGEYVAQAVLAAGSAPPERVTLSAGRVAQVRLRVPAGVARVEVVAPSPRAALEAREIRESFARDPGEALARLEGVQKVRKGGIANDVVVRNFRNDAVPVLVDGHPVHGACPNRMDPPAFHVDFAEVERIEVRKGPFDVAHPGALGGSVNIVTRRPGPGLHASAALGFGTAGYVAPAATVSYGAERWSLLAGASSRRSDPYADGDGLRFTARSNYGGLAQGLRAFDVRTVWATGSVVPAAGQRVELQATRQRADGALYPYLQMDSPRDEAQRFRAAYVVEAPWPRVRRLAAAASLSRVEHDMDDRYRATAGAMPRPYSMATFATSRIADEQVTLDLQRVTLGVGAYQRRWDAATLLALRQYAPQSSIPDVHVDSAGAFASWDALRSARTTLAFGARVDRVRSRATADAAPVALWSAYNAITERTRDDTLVAANVRWTDRPSSALRTSVALGYSMQVPDPVERFFGLQRMGTDWTGNPGLEPPRNTELDLGLVVGEGTGLSLEVSVFAASIRDHVAVVPRTKQRDVPGVVNTRARSYANTGARSWGGELTLRWAPGARWLVSAGASSVRGRLGVDPAAGVHDATMPELPPLRGRLAVRYDTGRWFLENEVLAAAAQERVNSDALEVPTAGWGVWNVRAGVTFGRVSVTLGADNLFDRAYRENLSFARDPYRSGALVYEPGRTATVSLLVRY